jgi:hypothetical protein
MSYLFAFTQPKGNVKHLSRADEDLPDTLCGKPWVFRDEPDGVVGDSWAGREAILRRDTICGHCRARVRADIREGRFKSEKVPGYEL